MHIPSGPGYDAVNLKESLTEARAFFAKWFPDRNALAFANESWLNDPHIAHIMEGQGNIAAMQREMYIVPTKEGDEMLKYDLFPGNAYEEPKTTLQKKAKMFMEEGNRFSTAAMFILMDDIERIGNNPY
jgi:hypothetical protein